MQINLINSDWLFSLEAPVDAHLMSADTSDFDIVAIPHDWSIGMPFDKDEGELCTAYLPGGIGWYRKTFCTTEEMADRRVFVLFEGIYNNSTVYCNGIYLQMHPYGYTAFYLDLTDFLNPQGEDNLLAVSVDRSRIADSRWYTGSGIYRDVELRIAHKLHIPIWGVQVTTADVESDRCVLRAKIKINNADNQGYNYNVNLTVSKLSTEVISYTVSTQKISAQTEAEIVVEMQLTGVSLWSPESAELYSLKVEISGDDGLYDSHTVRFGIREIEFDPDKGFILNGIRTCIKGVCLHQELGIVGSAVPADLWRRHLRTFKECGCNAIRTAHNPPSSEFLDICDEMGFLVQLEFFDEWDNPKDKRLNGSEQSVDYKTRSYCEHFGEWAERDLKDTILRTINHPCIIQWGIGNEIEWTYTKYNQATGYFGADASGNYFWELPPCSKEKIRENIARLPEENHEIWRTAAKLSRWVKEIDETRPVIANCIFPSASYESGYTDALDIVGYSYRQVVYEYGHTNYPDKPIMGTENLPQWHEWKQVLEKEYLPGIFLWAGMDYLGEVGHVGEWPMKGLPYGLLDFTGKPKLAYYLFKGLWQEEPFIYIATNTLKESIYECDHKGRLVEKEADGWKRRLWDWHDMNEHLNYNPGDDVVIEIYSNCESITLFLEDKELETKNLADFEDMVYKWCLPCSPDSIRAVGRKGKRSVTEGLSKTGRPAALRICTDREILSAAEKEVAYFSVQLEDDAGNPVTWCEDEISFCIEGESRYLGVDNGDVCNVRGYKEHSVNTFKGRCILLLQATEITEITVVAKTASGFTAEIRVVVE